MFHDFLGNDRLIVRFISLYAMGLVLFFTAWTVSYLALPEGLISRFGPLNALAGDGAAGGVHDHVPGIAACRTRATYRAHRTA